MQRYEFKRGDTFDVAGDANQEIDGEDVSFAGVTISAVFCAATAQDLPTGEPFETVAGAWVDENAAPGADDYGLFQIEVAKETTVNWPEGAAVVDVAFTFPGGARVTTPGMPFRITKANRNST